MKRTGDFILITDHTPSEGILNLFLELGINVKTYQISTFKRTKSTYFSLSALEEINKLNLKPKTNVIIDDYLTDRQISYLSGIHKWKVHDKREYSNFFSLMNYVSSSYLTSLEKEIKAFLEINNMKFLSTNHGVLYLDSYDNALIHDIYNALKLGKVDYRYKKSKELLEMYPNLTDRLPLLCELDKLKLAVINHNIVPVSNKGLAKSLSNLRDNQYFLDADEFDHYRSEYIYLIRLSDMEDEKFVKNLIEIMPTLVLKSDRLQAEHINIVFLSYGISDFAFFQQNQALFGEALFLECKEDTKDKLALSIFEVSKNNIKDLYSNLSTYFNHIFLENTVSMRLRLPKEVYKYLCDLLCYCRIHSILKLDDEYLVEANIPNFFANRLIQFEDTDETVC